MRMDTTGAPEATDKRMRLRYAGVCRRCGTDLPARADAIYEKATKTVRCVDCTPSTAVGGEALAVVTASDPVIAAKPTHQRALSRERGRPLARV